MGEVGALLYILGTRGEWPDIALRLPNHFLIWSYLGSGLPDAVLCPRDSNWKSVLTVALRAPSLRVLRVLRTTIKRKIVFSRYQVLSQYIKTVFGSYYQNMMRGIKRDSSGKMGHQTSCGTNSTGSAPEEREPGALSEQQSLVAPSVPAALHVTHRQYNQDSSFTAWANYAVTPYITPSEEWCALRELRVTDTYRDGHIPRCEHEDAWCQT